MNMKMLTKLWMLIAMLSVSASVHAYPYDFEFDLLYYRIISDNEVEVTYGENKYSGWLYIPAQVEYKGKNYLVTEIGRSAFENCKDLTKVEFGPDIRKVSMYAFYDCSSLTSISIGGSVTEIGDFAFSGCSSLPSVTLPESLKSIGPMAFYKCGSLKEIVIPNSVTSIGAGAFQDCRLLKSVTFPKGLTAIEDFMLCNCINLETAGIPNTVTSIGENAFASCGLNGVYIPHSVQTIGEKAFSNGSYLTTVFFGAGVKKIGDKAFDGCNNLNLVATYAVTPPTITTDTFTVYAYLNATLYVPTGCKSAYQNTPWKAFKIEEDAFLGVDELVSAEAEIVGYYNMQGVMSTEPWDGVNIVVYSDGSRRKMMLKQ